MGELLGVLANRLHELRVLVAEHHRHHSGAHVEIAVAVYVDELDTLAAFEHDAGLEAPAEYRLCIACHPALVIVGEAEFF